MSGRGEHRFVDLVGVPAGTRCLRDPAMLASLMKEAAREAGASIVATLGRRLGGDDGTLEGVTCAVLLNESHITAHTYAEVGAVAIDAFTCGPRASARKAVELLVERAFPGGRIVQDVVVERFKGFPQETGESSGRDVSSSLPGSPAAVLAGSGSSGFCGGSVALFGERTISRPATPESSRGLVKRLLSGAPGASGVDENPKATSEVAQATFRVASSSSPDDLLFDPAHVRRFMEEDTVVLSKQEQEEGGGS